MKKAPSNGVQNGNDIKDIKYKKIGCKSHQKRLQMTLIEDDKYEKNEVNAPSESALNVDEINNRNCVH